MKRFLVMRRFPLPWLKRDATQNENTPLLQPRDDSTGGSEELSVVGADDSTELQQAGQNQSLSKAHRIPLYRSLGDCFWKYFLFVTNLLFSVMGLCVLVLGLWGLISKESFAQEKIGSLGTDPMLLFVTVGFLLSLLCLSGCVGTLRENSCLLRLYSAVVLVLITAQVLAAIIAYSFQGQIVVGLRSGMLTAMARYQDDLDLRFITDEIQTGLQCCGADNYRDWETNIYYNCSAPGVLACGVPATCCVDPLENGTVWNSQCGVGAQMLDEFSAQSVIFLGGCLGGISRWIEQHTGLIGTVSFVILSVQILTLFITTRLLDTIQWHKANSRYANAGDNPHYYPIPSPQTSSSDHRPPS